MNKPNLTLVTGGCRSGKSRLALRLANTYQNPLFLATAEATDNEMRKRIARHRTERDKRFVTVEAPRDPADALLSLSPHIDLVLLDCVTVWLSNLLHHYGEDAPKSKEINRLLEILQRPPINTIVVTNETGLGIVPVNARARQFRDLTGSVNQRIAEYADTVIMTVCGIPMTIK